MTKSREPKVRARVVADPRILYVQFTDPANYPPVEHSSLILAERNWDVVLLGTDAYGQNLSLPIHPRIVGKNLSLADAGKRQTFHYVFFLLWCLYWACTWRPAWIYASDPLAAPAAWLIRKIAKTQIVYHEHDSPNTLAAHSWFMKIVLWFRKSVATDAELCIIPQRQRMNDFLETTGRKGPTICVWNCPRLSEVLPARGSEKNDDSYGGLILYYHGSINRERLPEQLVVAASRFKGAIHLRIAGYEAPGSVGYVNSLVKLAAENNAMGIIEFLGTIPLREDLLQSASNAHVGLSFMPKRSNDSNLRNMVGASNKPFDYMARGLPLLVTDLPEWRSTFVAPGYARACDPDSVDSIAAELEWYLNNSEKRRDMGRRCANQIKQSWNYDRLFRKAVETLESGL